MLTRNYVAKHLYKANKPSVIASKKSSLLLDATLRDAAEDLTSELVDEETMHLDDTLQGYLDDVGCSSIEVADEEDGK